MGDKIYNGHLDTIFEQIEFCEYKDKMGQPLEKSQAFFELKELLDDRMQAIILFITQYGCQRYLKGYGDGAMRRYNADEEEEGGD